jgi:hypothetical protein
MTISPTELFDEIRDFARRQSSSIEVGANVGPVKAGTLCQNSHKLFRFAGLYVYSVRGSDGSDRVVYIGKGTNRSKRHSVEARAWNHLGKAASFIQLKTGDEKELGFPDHQWAQVVWPELQQAFKNGTLLVSAISISPVEQIREMERFGIAFLKNKEPRCLNRQS